MLEGTVHLTIIGIDRNGEVVREFPEFRRNGVDLNNLVRDLKAAYPEIVRVVIDAAV